MTIREQAFEFCVEHLRSQVIRGDTEQEITLGQGGFYGGTDKVSIGGYVWAGEEAWNPANLSHKLTKLEAGEMVVEAIEGVQCCEIFTVKEVVEDIEKRWIPTVAKLRRSRQEQNKDR